MEQTKFIQMGELDDIKTEFLQIISHEIRTPLNHIVGFNMLLQEMEQDEGCAKYRSIINSAVKRLEQFSYRALDVTQLRTLGSKALKKDNIDLSGFLKNFLENHPALAPEKKIHFHIKSEGVCRIEGDQKYLEKVTRALIENAVNHVQGNGKIIIESVQKAGKVIMKVIDNGEGFSEKALQTLFNPVSPGVNSDNNPHIGLGLYFVKLVMDAHNGKVTAGNNKRGGAWVELAWPA